jgi:hypothetical protein
MNRSLISAGLKAPGLEINPRFHEPLIRAEAIGDSNAQFPLTPALSLGERGILSGVIGQRDRFMVTVRVEKDVEAFHEPWCAASAIGDSDAGFPLTPALSLREREVSSAVVGPWDRFMVPMRVRKTSRLSMNPERRRRKGPPLPCPLLPRRRGRSCGISAVRGTMREVASGKSLPDPLLPRRREKSGSESTQPEV